MSQPKISIVMAVYNEQPTFLKKAIDSILHQTYTDFEFIIIDDGSNDATKKILSLYIKQSPKIKLLTNHKNIGLTKSLNLGIKKSTGQYIARMDSDDISMPERLKQQLNFLLKNNYDFVTSDYSLIDHKERFLSKKTIHISFNAKQQLLKGNIFIHSTFFGKKEVFEELYNINFKRAQDYEFLLRIVGKGYTIGNLPKICLKYRINDMGISFKNSREQEWSAIQARILALKNYGYNKLYSFYLLRSFLVFLLPPKLKRFLLQ